MHLDRTIRGLTKVSFTIIMALIKAQERLMMCTDRQWSDRCTIAFVDIYQACHVQVQSMTDDLTFEFKTDLVLLGVETITFRYFTNCCIPLNLRICLRNSQINRITKLIENGFQFRLNILKILFENLSLSLTDPLLDFGWGHPFKSRVGNPFKWLVNIWRYICYNNWSVHLVFLVLM